MIPVPVYECNMRDWVDANLADQWINACEIDSTKIVEDVNVDANQIIAVDDDALPRFLQQTNNRSSDSSNSNNNNNSNCKSPDILINDAVPPEHREHSEICEEYPVPAMDLDDVPAIAVTPGSSISGGSSFDDEPNSNSNLIQYDIDQTGSAGESGENAAANVATATDYVVEVRKRYSNDENRNSDNTQSSGSGKSSPKCNLDEKRRIDKSKRRKGIYIQWAALDKHNKQLNTMNWTGDGDSSQENSSAILQDIDTGDVCDTHETIWPLPVSSANGYDTDAAWPSWQVIFCSILRKLHLVRK